MRETFLCDLVGDVIGPRGGLRETMGESPLSEYVTGVLAPAGSDAAPDIDAAAELPTEEYTQETEETEIEEGVGITPFAPVLDPQSRPFSMGLSFAVVGEGEAARFHICLTWARYLRLPDSRPPIWQRQPRFCVLRNQPVSASSVWLDHQGAVVPAENPGAEVFLHVRVTQVAGRPTLCSVYLVNRIRVPQDQHPTADYHIYQPQIRIKCTEGLRVAPGLESSTDDREEKVLTFLYRDRPVLARGHLTSAVWRSIDPQVHDPAVPLDAPDALAKPPFRWVDGELLPPPDKLTFTGPDVRTEYTPMSPVASPLLTLRENYAAATELRSEVLAEMVDARVLDAALRPLITGYRRWLAEQRGQLQDLSSQEREIAESLLASCDIASARMERGLALLSANEEARLAFCFAMKAMAVQHGWSAQGGTLVWRPFQLGFILTALESLVDPCSVDRDVCDLLWVPTGGGKTEAYLALIALALGLRRRRGEGQASAAPARPSSGAGVGVLSRYTLRLLTIQQFRRTSRLITACEVLRVTNLGHGQSVGWRPGGYASSSPFLWGSSRFSCGLWVGTSVAPNRLQDTWADGRSVPGALTLLRSGGDEGGEPAQILRCPACNDILAVPNEGAETVPINGYLMNWVVRGTLSNIQVLTGLTCGELTIRNVSVRPLPHGGFSAITVRVHSRVPISARAVDALWDDARAQLGNVTLIAARASRPGYFLRWYRSQQGTPKAYDFEIYCPSPDCALNLPWCEALPAGCVHGAIAQMGGPLGGIGGTPRTNDGYRLAHVHEAFVGASGFIGTKVPIPAYTVDDQVYQRCPSVVIATVDKFARPPFEPRAAALFGNVDHHHCIYGYYRLNLHSGDNRGDPHPSPAGTAGSPKWTQVQPFSPPDLVLQDELHLIEGPLGSLVGLYETAVDILCRNQENRPVKYVASTATVREASAQVQAVFQRRLMTFPPSGLSAQDSFFVSFPPNDPLRDNEPGRLYIGICAPGRGPLTPVLRLWARLLQTAHRFPLHQRVDPFWTLTGYFNAIRELAGARALYRQDIPERCDLLARLDAYQGIGPRPLPEERMQELSGRMDSTALPVVLELLNELHGQDALFTTSMFGTGVDIARLGLMIVNGQPKTTSSYIQATGRVGRRSGGLVATFLRATRPRDLNHYEFFCGYHMQMHRYVEPVTVMPFAPGTLDRGIGPVGVFLLRNKRGTTAPWALDTQAGLMGRLRTTDNDVASIPTELEQRAVSQPGARAPRPNFVLGLARSALDDWWGVAGRNPTSLVYCEYGPTPTTPVVLGDPQHQHAGLEVAYHNVPSSLRDIEETCGFQTD